MFSLIIQVLTENINLYQVFIQPWDILFFTKCPLSWVTKCLILSHEIVNYSQCVDPDLKSVFKCLRACWSCPQISMEMLCEMVPKTSLNAFPLSDPSAGILCNLYFWDNYQYLDISSFCCSHTSSGVSSMYFISHSCSVSLVLGDSMIFPSDIF